MEVSGSATAPAQVPVREKSATEVEFKKKLGVIKASKSSETEQVNKIKMLQHVTSLSIFRRTKDLLGDIATNQFLLRKIAEFSAFSLDVTNEIYSQSYTTQPTQRDLIESTRFLYSIQRILTPKENYVLSQYIESRINDNSASVPRPVSEATNEELEQCFSSLGIDYKVASLTAIKKAVQDRIPSKQDIEITARVIEKELERHDIDYQFPVFTEDNYFQEFFERIYADDFPSNSITQLGFYKAMVALPLYAACPLKVIPNILRVFKNLTDLDIMYCTNLTELPDLSHNLALTHLSLEDCTSLSTIPNLRNNSKLTVLDFSNCTSLQTPPDLNHNQLLTELSFFGCTSLTELPDLSCHQALTDLHFSGCTSLTELPDLSHNQVLTHLYFQNCTNFTAPPDLNSNQALTHLDFSYCTNLQTPPDLNHNQLLTELNFYGCTNLQTPPDLNRKHALTWLSFAGCTNLQTPPDLSSNQALTCLSFHGCTSLTELPDLSHNLALTHLDFSYCQSLTELPDLSHNLALTHLDFSYCQSLTELPDLSHNLALTHLDFSYCQSLTELPDLSMLPNLIQVVGAGVAQVPKTVFDHLTIFFTETIPNFFRAIADFFKNLFE